MLCWINGCRVVSVLVRLCVMGLKLMKNNKACTFYGACAGLVKYHILEPDIFVAFYSVWSALATCELCAHDFFLLLQTSVIWYFITVV